MSRQYIKIYYGPCDTFGTLAHKPQKLRGLKDRLQKIGYRIDLIPVDYVNYCVLESCGHEVFRCNIQNLKFNTSYLLDPVCQRAIQAVLKATAMYARARRYIWLHSTIEHDLINRSQYGPKNYWPTNEIETSNMFEDCADCLICCGIQTKRDKMKNSSCAWLP